MKRKIVLIASLVAGLLAAFITRVYIATKEGEVQEQRQRLLKRYGTIDAVVFGRDTPAGTSLTKRDLGVLTLPALGLRGQAITEETLISVLGRKTLLGHKEGDVLMWSDVEGGDPTAGGLSADVKRQSRAMSINVSGSASVSGMVRPNDHVDVIGTFDFPGEDGRRNKGDLLTYTILQNVLVLAVGSETAKDRPRNLGLRQQGYSTVTLEVTPREAEMLAFAEQIKGRLMLTLRNRNDTTYEKELPKVDFKKIQDEIEELNAQRQQKMGAR